MEVLINNAEVVCAGCSNDGPALHLCSLKVNTDNEVCINLCPECINKLAVDNSRWWHERDNQTTN